MISNERVIQVSCAAHTACRSGNPCYPVILGLRDFSVTRKIRGVWIRHSRSTSMIRVTGRYQKQSVELDAPLGLSDGTVVEIVVRVKPDSPTEERTAFMDFGLARLEEEWDNPEDAIYDDWKKLYGL